MERSAGLRYIPRWSEVVVTLCIVGVGIVIFTLATKYLPIFTHASAPQRVPERAVATAAQPVPELAR